MTFRGRNSGVRAVIALFVLIGAQGRADARHVQFLGAHPIASKYGGGFCYIEAPHVHAYAPDHVGLYQQVGDEFVFTGDPTTIPLSNYKEIAIIIGTRPAQIPSGFDKSLI